MSGDKKDDRSDGSDLTLSRRGFVKLLSTTTAATMIGTSTQGAQAASPTTEQSPGGAEQIYQCKPELKRFSVKNIAFKRVSEEIGKPWFKVWFGSMLGNVKESRIGKGIPVKSSKEARAHVAFWVGAATWNRICGPYGEGLENKGFLSWKPVHVPPMFRGNPDADPDPVDLTKKMKQIARFVGANRVGVAKLNRKWVYEETCKNAYAAEPPQTKPIVFKDVKAPDETDTELIIPESVQYAIVTIIDLNRLCTQIGPASIQTSVATNMAYARMGITDVALAEAIRTLGYNAIPTMNSTALSVPLAVDAGLGQLGRHGLLINPDYGSAIRVGKVLTDMPLVPDHPIDFGVTEFCERCKKCASSCPANAISLGDRTYEPVAETNNPGALKWYVNHKKCLRYWMEAGASCAACQAVCPYTKGNLWVHGATRSLADNVPSLTPLLVSLDDIFGYGAPRSPEVVWDMNISPFGIDFTKES